MEFALIPSQLTGPHQQVQGMIRAGTAGAFASLSCQQKPRLSASTAKRQRGSRKLIFCLAAAPAREPPTAPWAGEENELLDCVIVGGGIGGKLPLPAAEAFQMDSTSVYLSMRICKGWHANPHTLLTANGARVVNPGFVQRRYIRVSISRDKILLIIRAYAQWPQGRCIPASEDASASTTPLNSLACLTDTAAAARTDCL